MGGRTDVVSKGRREDIFRKGRKKGRVGTPEFLLKTAVKWLSGWVAEEERCGQLTLLLVSWRSCERSNLAISLLK